MIRAVNAILLLSKGKLPKPPGIAGYNPHMRYACGWGGGDEHIYGFKNVTPEEGAMINKTMDARKSVTPTNGS